MAFVGSNLHPQVIVWLGSPDCQAGHEAILNELAQVCNEFLTNVTQDDPNLNVIKGNLGEFIGFCLGKWNTLSQFQVFAANAFTPLSAISKPEIDIVWLYFGDTPDEDIAVLQEVKTTGQISLSYADKLMLDYDKLFGTNPALTLQTRLQAIKNKLEYEHRRKDLCKRVSQLAGNTPQTSTGIRLLPTLIYEKDGADPKTKMIAIRSALCGKGWSSSAVEAWALGLSNLNLRLIRLATGRN
jgi:hypothetical protein